jgi:hypothetical protein
MQVKTTVKDKYTQIGMLNVKTDKTSALRTESKGTLIHNLWGCNATLENKLTFSFKFKHSSTSQLYF